MIARSSRMAPANGIARDDLGGGQALGVLLETLDPEQLRANRLFDAYPSSFVIRWTTHPVPS